MKSKNRHFLLLLFSLVAGFFLVSTVLSTPALAQLCITTQCCCERPNDTGDPGCFDVPPALPISCSAVEGMLIENAVCSDLVSETADCVGGMPPMFQNLGQCIHMLLRRDCQGLTGPDQVTCILGVIDFCRQFPL